MSSSRRTSKPPRPFESLASLKAAKKTYCSIDYQIECLNELYNQLMPTQNGGNRRAGGSSGDHQDGSQRESKALQQLKRELKANLRSNYGSPRLFPPLERLKVVVMFDDRKKAFFDIRLRPLSGYPTGYPFLIDDSEGTIVGLSEAIYQEVLKAVQEEEEEERDRDEEGHNNNNPHNNSHAAEVGLDPVNIKQEVVDEEEEEEEELITLDDDSDEDESLNNELQQEESYNSQVVNPPPAAAAENNAVPESEDFIVSAISAAAASSSSVPAIVPPENGSPAVNPQATDTDADISNSISNNNTAEHEQRQTTVSSSGSTVNRRQSETLPIKLEPAGTSSTVTITREGRPPKRALQTAHEEAPAAAAAAASVAVSPPPAAASNFRILQVNL